MGLTVRAADGAVEHGFRAGRRDRENRSLAVRTTREGRAVERALHVDEPRKRKCAIVSGAASEAGEHGVRRSRAPSLPARERSRSERSDEEKEWEECSDCDIPHAVKSVALRHAPTRLKSLPVLLLSRGSADASDNLLR